MSIVIEFQDDVLCFINESTVVGNTKNIIIEEIREKIKDIKQGLDNEDNE